MFDIRHFLQFLEDSPTALHAASAGEHLALSAGAVALDPGAPWKLERGGLYLLRNRGVLTLFRVGIADPAEAGFALAAAHTDSPGLKLKWGAGSYEEPYFRIPVEVYGGPIISTWLDRELSCAGLISGIGEGGQPFSRELRSSRPLALIPNLAIHLNRDINKGYSYNEQEELQALFPGFRDSREILSACGFDGSPGAAESIHGDLFLFDPSSPVLLGDHLLSGRIDNLASCWAGIGALLDADPGKATSLLFLADGEEIGSRMDGGADSAILSGLLRRLVAILSGKGEPGGLEEAYQRAISRSFLISADGAHGVHPNFRSKHDSGFAPVPGKGPALKKSGTFRYTTRADGAVRTEMLAMRAGVSLQTFISRSDMKSGSTVGPLLSSSIPVGAVDMGVPMLSMHSVRESCAGSDLLGLMAVLREHFSTSPCSFEELQS